MKIYTTEDLLQMRESGHLSMSELATRRLNRYQVVVEENNKTGISLLNAPQSCAQDDLVDTLLYSFTLPEYAVRIGISEKTHRNRVVRKFFTFLDSKNYLTKTNNKNGNTITSLPPHCFKDWLEHLKKTTTSKTTWSNMHYMRLVLSRALTKRYSKKTTNWPSELKAAWQVLCSCTPTKPNHTKSLALGAYLGIPSTQFTNQELHIGLRYGVIWLLQRFQKQRDVFNTNPAIKQALDNIKGCTLAEIKKTFSDFTGLKATQEASNKKINYVMDNNCREAAWEIILNDPLLTEWQSRKNPDWSPLKIWLGSTQPCFWGAHWLIHSNLEQLLMVWLLGSERTQRIGIEKLTFSGIHVTKRELQISTLKLRRASNPHAKAHHTDVKTQIYRLNEPVGEVYYQWLQQAKRAQDSLSEFNVASRYFYGSGSQLAGTILRSQTKNVSDSFLPLELLSIPGTVWHDTFLKESSGIREAQAFIAILANRIEKIKTGQSQVNIPIRPIGESLVIRKEVENNFDTTFNLIVSETLGHSETTGRNIYKDGFRKINDSDIQEPILAFARKVGDKKIELAIQMADKLNKTSKPISFNELETLCGIQSSRKTQQDLLAKLDMEDKLNITGELAIGDNLVIVQTDLTAAMMWGYLKHLEANLPTIMVSDRDKNSIRHLAQYLHLTEVYSRLRINIQQAGKKLANELQFPFPPLS